jgi:hypothetical protein
VALNPLLKQAIGCPSCDNTAPMQEVQAPVSLTNYIVKSGNANTRVVVIAVFNLSKAACSDSDKENCLLCIRLVNGLAKTL